MTLLAAGQFLEGRLAVPLCVCLRSLVLSLDVCKNPCSNSQGLTVLYYTNVLPQHQLWLTSLVPSSFWAQEHGLFFLCLHYPELLSGHSRRTAVSFHLSLSFRLTQVICFQDISSKRLIRVSQHIWHNYDYVSWAISKNDPLVATNLPMNCPRCCD